MAAFNELSPLQLSRLIGLPDSPVIIDVRIPDDVAADPRVIPGSQPRSYRDVASWAGQFAGRRVVTTCQKGHKLSQGVAAWLRHVGASAETLQGGHLAWAAAGLPLIPIAARPQASLWVTRSRPKVDRIACPWLIRRFIDADAVFLFVAPAEVADVASRFDATPFDIEGVHWSHRGPLCTFDVMLDEWGLRTPALDRLSLIVRGADTAAPDLAPEAAGLLAISFGLSRMYRDDLAQLDAGCAVYDALYRWCRDASDETHDWPTGKAA